MLLPFHAAGEAITAARQTNGAHVINPGSTLTSSAAFKPTEMKLRSRSSSPEPSDVEQQNISYANVGMAPSFRSGQGRNLLLTVGESV